MPPRESDCPHTHDVCRGSTLTACGPTRCTQALLLDELEDEVLEGVNALSEHSLLPGPGGGRNGDWRGAISSSMRRRLRASAEDAVSIDDDYGYGDLNSLDDDGIEDSDDEEEEEQQQGDFSGSFSAEPGQEVLYTSRATGHSRGAKVLAVHPGMSEEDSEPYYTVKHIGSA